jgi:glycosyltransferase involved in cell wall biosynthesis
VSRPAFSVITPAYRAPRTIRATIESVLAQSFGDFEHVVVDDGSGDETPEVVREYAAQDPRIRLIEQANAGTAAARNIAIAASSGRYVSLLDNDDVWVSEYLRTVNGTLEADGGAGLVYTDAWPFDDATRRIHRLTSLEDYPPVAPAASPEVALRALLRLNFVTASSTTIRREALDRVGGFDPALSGSDDWDLWLRIAGAGYRVVRAGDRPLVLLRERATSQSKNDLQMRRSGVMALRRAVEHTEDPELRAVGEATLAEHERQLRRAESSSAAARALAAVKRPLVRAKVRLLWRGTYRPASDEVLAAYPDLHRH